VTTNPLVGSSLLPVLFNNVSQVDRGAPLFWERAGNRAVRDGKWKLVSTYPSYEWELYNIETDRGETTNVAQQNPGIVNQLSAAYFDWADKTGVVEYSKFKLKTEVMPGGAALKK